MVRLDYLLFGYLTLEISEGRMTEALNLALRLGIRAEAVGSHSLTMSYPSFRKFRKRADPALISSVGDVRGSVGVILLFKKRTAAMIALLFCMGLYFLSGNLVWDVRVSAGEGLDEATVLSELERAGVFPGQLWARIDKKHCELAVLDSSEEISWISINRRGTVAYVEAVRRVDGEEPVAPVGIGNIVADRDCVIEEITVKRGTAVVKVGDTVRKGELLISGVVQTERGTEYTHAEGVVIGICDGEVSYTQSKFGTELLGGKAELSEFSLKIFQNKINIINTYGNSPEGCAIIEDERQWTLFGRRLPISSLSVRATPITEVAIEYSEAQMIELAHRGHAALLSEMLATSSPLRIRTSADYTEDGYTVRSRVVYSTEVGEYKPIETDMEEKW